MLAVEAWATRLAELAAGLSVLPELLLQGLVGPILPEDGPQGQEWLASKLSSCPG